MELNVQTDAAKYATAITAAEQQTGIPIVVDAAKTDALKAAAQALAAACDFGAKDTVDVHMAFGDNGTWAVVRVAKVVPGE